MAVVLDVGAILLYMSSNPAIAQKDNPAKEATDNTGFDAWKYPGAKESASAGGLGAKQSNQSGRRGGA